MTARERPRRRAQVQEDIDMLTARLRSGYVKIEQAREKGDDVTAWEDFWIELLCRYETEVEYLKDIGGKEKEGA